MDNSRYRLVEIKLGRNLAGYLRDARRAKKSFHVIGNELAQKTGENLSPETIRKWVRDMETASGTEPSYVVGPRQPKAAA